MRKPDRLLIILLLANIIPVAGCFVGTFLEGQDIERARIHEHDTINLPPGEDFVQYISHVPPYIITRNHTKPHVLTFWLKNPDGSLTLYKYLQEN